MRWGRVSLLLLLSFSYLSECYADDAMDTVNKKMLAKEVFNV